MADRIKCTRCRSWKKRRKNAQPKNAQSYVCTNCRYNLLAKNSLKKIIEHTTKYKTLKKLILVEVKNFEIKTELPISQRQQIFIKNIEKLMHLNYIRDYNFNIIDNKLESITIQIPFVDQMNILIYGKKR